MFKLGLDKAEDPEIKLPMIYICWIIDKAREFQTNIYFCFIDYAKTFVWITTNCGKFLKRWEYQTTLPASWKSCMQVKKRQLELGIEQWTGFRLEKEYIRALYCHPAYLTYVQSTSYEMSGLVKLKLESRLPGEISTTSDRQITLPLWQKEKRNWTAEDERGQWKRWL